MPLLNFLPSSRHPSHYSNSQEPTRAFSYANIERRWNRGGRGADGADGGDATDSNPPARAGEDRGNSKEGRRRRRRRRRRRPSSLHRRARRSGGLTRTIDPTKHRGSERERERAKAAAAVARWFLVLRPQKKKVEILLCGHFEAGREGTERRRKEERCAGVNWPQRPTDGRTGRSA